jgi:ABC-type multidrug transport system fused ATPase/permease subunit
LYTSQLAAKTYTNIPVDLSKYLRLREIARKAHIKYSANSALAVLFQITVDAITGSINAYGLNKLNIEVQVQNNYLQTTIEEVISGVNVTKAFDENTGTISMTKTFELAPLFRYYISLYGMPEIGVGFDPVKLALVLTALEKSGIDPYQ